MTRSNGTHGHPLDRRVYPDEQHGENGAGQYPPRQYSPYPPRRGGAPHQAPPEPMRGYDGNVPAPHDDQWAYPQQPMPPQHDNGAGYPDYNGAGGYNGAAGYNGAGEASPAYHYPAQQPAYGEPPYRGQGTFDERADYPPELPVGGGQDPNGYEPAFTQYDAGHGQGPAVAGYDDDPTRGLSQFRHRGQLDNGRDEGAAYHNGSPFPELRGTNFDHDVARQYAPNGRPPEFGLGEVAPGRGFEEPANPAAYGQWDNYQHQQAPLPNGHGGYADAGYDPNGPAGYAPDNGALTQHEHAYAEDEYEDDYEEPRGGLGRKLLIGSALVGSIFVGGIIAFGYGVLFGGSPGASGEPPVVRASADPARVEPTDPGGRQFPNTDSRLIKKMGSRAPEGAAGAAPAGNADDPSRDRVKVVTTMTFDRNGRMVVANTGGGDAPAHANVATASTSAPSDTGLPPGTTVGTTDGFGPPPGTTVSPRPSPPPTNRAPPQPEVVAETRVPPPAAPSSPRRRGRFPPLPERAAYARTSPRIPPANVQPVQPQPRPQRVAVAAPAEPAAAAANGYVAVLSTKRTRIDALKSYADLQQRYGSVLSGAIPDVQKADLRSRGLGLMYRVVVGPPGSRQAALKVCGRLRSAGYKGCWVKAY